VKLRAASYMLSLAVRGGTARPAVNPEKALRVSGDATGDIACA
jgi:hypothetical protein